MKKLSIILLLLSCVMSYGQFKFNKVSFTKGLPNQVKFKWEKAEYAAINIGDYYKNLFVICQDTNSLESSMFYATVHNDGSFDIGRLNQQTIKNNIFSAVINMVDTLEDELLPLELRISKAKGVIEYAWGDSLSGYFPEPKVSKEYLLKAGKIFPSISLESQDGIVNTDEFKGKIVVINWWATNCIPCREEIPGLNKLVEKYKNKLVEFLSIIWNRENLENFLKEHPFYYKHLYGNEKIGELLGEAFPRNLIIDKNNRIIYNKTGGFIDEWKILDEIINKAL